MIGIKKKSAIKEKSNTTPSIMTSGFAVFGVKDAQMHLLGNASEFEMAKDIASANWHSYSECLIVGATSIIP